MRSRLIAILGAPFAWVRRSFAPSRGAAPVAISLDGATPAAPVSLRPPPEEIMAAAKDFDDGAATVLVPRIPAPRIPVEALPNPTYTHQGERFGLGYLEDAFGIWYLHQRRAPVELFPRTAEGWADAWGSFVKMEPRHEAVKPS